MCGWEPALCRLAMQAKEHKAKLEQQPFGPVGHHGQKNFSAHPPYNSRILQEGYAEKFFNREYPPGRLRLVL